VAAFPFELDARSCVAASIFALSGSKALLAKTDHKVAPWARYLTPRWGDHWESSSAGQLAPFSSASSKTSKEFELPSALPR
jgi:hypothetical protein